MSDEPQFPEAAPPAGRRHVGPRYEAFVSHSSTNRVVAARVESEFGAGNVWFDRSDIRLGALLGRELIGALQRSRAVVLVWSSPASLSPWVQAEWIAGVNLGLPILPLVVDETVLPQCLVNAVRVSAAPSVDDAVAAIVRTVRGHLSPDGSISSPMALTDDALDADVARLGEDQLVMLDSLNRGDLAKAEELQRSLEGKITALAGQHPLDPRIATLWAYNAKNEVLLAHDEEIRAGIRVTDPRLEEARWRFLYTLGLDPLEPSALNGLGTIAWFAHDLDTAEFFVRAALRQAPGYPAAESDLHNIQALKRRHSSG